MEKQLEEAFDKMKAHQYHEGLDMLESIPERTARWYYISGYGNSCVGNNLKAREMVTEAVNMEPDNSEYKRLLNHLGGSVKQYENSEHGNGLGTSPKGIQEKDESCCECCAICCLEDFINDCDCIKV